MWLSCYRQWRDTRSAKQSYECVDGNNRRDGRQVIIWSRFRHDIIKITEKLKQTYGSDTVVNYFGDTTMQDRQDAIEKFQNLKSNVKFFISNPQTGGMGITLHAYSANVIYYSNDFNLESRKQSEDRAHRVGQHQTSFVC